MHGVRYVKAMTSRRFKSRNKPKKARIVRTPGAGRNEALRPGGGPHRSAQEKRAADRLRRDVDERLDDD